MEKQKIFWVVLSVSIFMVVLLIVGVFVVKQKPAAAVLPDSVSPLTDMGTRIFEFGQETPSTAPAQGTAQGTSREPEVLKFVIGEEAPAEKPRTQKTAPSVLAPVAANTPAAAPETQAPKTVAPAAEKPKTPAPAPKKAVPEAPRTVKTVEYWIQTGSYASQTRAEDLAKLLTAKGLPGRVLSHTVDSKLYFRVRIGPYTDKSEAGKFLSIVKQIEGLEASYISSVPVTRKLN